MRNEKKDGKRQNIISHLESMEDPAARRGMEKYGIRAGRIYGVRIPDLRKIAAEIGKDHDTALWLWRHDSRETRILAGMIDDPGRLTSQQMEDWVNDFDSWEVCDQCCMNLFEKVPAAYAKAGEWSCREKEFVKRAGFVLMARLAVSDKQAPDERFLEFFPHLRRESGDSRNFVKKAVNWALRQIGKRNIRLNRESRRLAEEIRSQGTPSARWIAADALRELESRAVQTRLEKRRRKERMKEELS